MLALIPKTLIDIDTVFHLKTEIEAISILKVKKSGFKDLLMLCHQLQSCFAPLKQKLCDSLKALVKFIDDSFI